MYSAPLLRTHAPATYFIDSPHDNIRATADRVAAAASAVCLLNEEAHFVLSYCSNLRRVTSRHYLVSKVGRL
jgi:hypothetical protein